LATTLRFSHLNFSEEELVKQFLAVGVLLGLAATDALAQGSEIYTRYGPSGSHFTLSSSAQSFSYEATVTGTTAPCEVQLEVYHNATLKFTDSKVVPIPGNSYIYSCSVGMSTWGLKSGDTVTFVLKVVDTATGATLATHYLFGDAAGT
jgi:hypothetical protein